MNYIKTLHTPVGCPNRDFCTVGKCCTASGHAYCLMWHVNASFSTFFFFSFWPSRSAKNPGGVVKILHSCSSPTCFTTVNNNILPNVNAPPLTHEPIHPLKHFTTSYAPSTYLAAARKRSFKRSLFKLNVTFASCTRRVGFTGQPRDPSLSADTNTLLCGEREKQPEPLQLRGTSRQSRLGSRLRLLTATVRNKANIKPSYNAQKFSKKSNIKRSPRAHSVTKLPSQKQQTFFTRLAV